MPVIRFVDWKNTTEETAVNLVQEYFGAPSEYHEDWSEKQKVAFSALQDAAEEYIQESIRRTLEGLLSDKDQRCKVLGQLSPEVLRLALAIRDGGADKPGEDYSAQKAQSARSGRERVLAATRT